MKAKILKLDVSDKIEGKGEITPISLESEDEHRYKYLVEDLFSDSVFEIESYKLPIGNLVTKDEARIFLESIRKFEKDHLSSGELFVFDMSEYNSRVPLFDAIATTLYELRKIKKVNILSIVDSLPLVEISKNIGDIGRWLAEDKLNIYFVDNNGNLQVFGVSKNTTPTRFTRFAKPIKPLTEQEFRNLAAYDRTTRYLGHFIPHSKVHVRTHYDIDNLIHDEKAYSFIKKKFEDLCREKEFDLILGFGLCSTAISALIEALGRSMEIPHNFIYEGAINSIQGAIERGQKRVLLISDVVNSGKTAKKQIGVVNSFGGEVVGLFVIISMENSVKIIDGISVYSCTKFGKTYYEEGKCLLCKLGYPERSVEIADQFRKVFKYDTQPLDFWELIDDAKAFRAGHQVISSVPNHYLYYIDTPKVFNKYGDWIATVLAGRIKREKINIKNIHHLVCPDAEGARLLCEKLATKIKMKHESIVLIDREDIRKSLPTSIEESVRKKYERLKGKNILLIDDGVNTLNTYSGFKNLASGLGSSLVAYVVFLSRLSPQKMSGFEKEDIKFIDFYHWPIPPLSSGECLICN